MPLDSRYSLQNGDLKDLVVPKISIDEFNPKTGEAKDVIVTAFYMSEKAPAEDLTQFIETGAYETLDVETSPNPDDDGNHLIFIEMKRDEDFMEKLKGIVEDVENLVGSNNYKVKSYFAEESYSISDPALGSFVIVDPSQYMTKEEFTKAQESKKVEKEKLDVVNFIKDSYINKLGMEDKILEFTSSNGVQKFDMLNFGKAVLDEYAQKPILVNSIEDNKLQHSLGRHWSVNKLSTDVVAISKTGCDDILTLRRRWETQY